MDGGGTNLKVVRCEIGRKGSIERGVMKMSECLSFIKIRVPPHYSSASFMIISR